MCLLLLDSSFLFHLVWLLLHRQTSKFRLLSSLLKLCRGTICFECWSFCQLYLWRMTYLTSVCEFHTRMIRACTRLDWFNTLQEAVNYSTWLSLEFATGYIGIQVVLIEWPVGLMLLLSRRNVPQENYLVLSLHSRYEDGRMLLHRLE